MKLVAFDLDGTLLRGESVWEAIARGIGRLERVREMERIDPARIEDPSRMEDMAAAIEESAGWYSSFTFDELLEHVSLDSSCPRSR